MPRFDGRLASEPAASAADLVPAATRHRVSPMNSTQRSGQPLRAALDDGERTAYDAGMPDALNVISTHFGPSLVSIGRGLRVSFARAWKDPALRQNAINAAVRALNSERSAAGKAPSVANERIVLIAGLLRKVILQEGG